ncbi:anthocyanidin 3-O-glucosyltransferase 2-like [Salvia miltiorrhiza]|uniref:anthocyanidin 3-O-glucosyltransferase 2-like n=1 Tax=Salvia miltiorrhiza TaxID=226208 RepID=UPI0025ABA10D|nr:anthocyanidin 3-O-glucosyltransferase 2-like [Salvia miltiorrhiza]
MSVEDVELIFVPGPGIGHIVPAIEVGKLMLDEHTRLAITFLLINDPVIREYTNSSGFHYNPRLRLLTLPEPEEGKSPSSDFRTKSELPPVKALVNVDRHKPLVREAVLGIMMKTRSRVVGFVVDMFCLSMTDVADEFSIPNYVFFTSGADFLSLMMTMRRLTDEDGIDITEFKDSDQEFSVAGFLNPVPAKVMPSMMLDKNGGSDAAMSTARRIRKSRGIFINTFQELEPNIIQSLSNSNDDDQMPPIYAVGPLLNLETKPESRFSDIINWLDLQPRKSVVFLCFGSEGGFSEEQIKHLGAALETSGRRFLWSLRRRKQRDSSIPVEILPEGFLQRTNGVGRVIGWAPQAAVLSHAAVGGFVSHCGWNSVLESMWCGVPMAAWPLYAEQQVNAFQVVAELGVAVEVRVDYREDTEIVVSAEEIAAAIERLMERESGVRERAAEMREKSSAAVVGGGSSRKFLASLVRDILHNSSG